MSGKDTSFFFLNRAPEVKSMRQYMDEHHAINPDFQDGNGWYDEQAYRAMNQGLGRCIRHSRDYGAILLLESRFQKIDSRKNLSKWFRNTIQVVSNKHILLSELATFFDSCEKEFPTKVVIKQELADMNEDSSDIEKATSTPVKPPSISKTISLSSPSRNPSVSSTMKQPSGLFPNPSHSIDSSTIDKNTTKSRTSETSRSSSTGNL